MKNLLIIASALMAMSCRPEVRTEYVYVQSVEDRDSIARAVYMAEDAYCQEIDSLVVALLGYEIDADAVDTSNAMEMEKVAYELLGDVFYRWRYLESTKAWEYDVEIARHCY